MDKNTKTRELLIEHYTRYPKMQIADLFKLLHQSSLGCEHMVSSLDTAINYISREYQAMVHRSDLLIERLDGEYSRVHLSCMDKGVSAEELGRLFYLSARKEEHGRESLIKKLEVAKELVRDGVLPFSEEAFQKAVDEWEKLGYPAIHHSNVFREEYHPAYRVIANERLGDLAF